MKQVYALLLFASLQGAGQDYVRQASFSTETGTAENNKAFEVSIRKNDAYSAGYLNNIPSKVLAIFTKAYPGAINVSFVIDEKETTAYCNWENELVIEKYKNNGILLYTRKTYTIEKLDRPFTDFLKRELGTKHDVNYITEFINEHSRDYEISMSNDREWLTVKLTRDKSSGGLVITEKKLFNK